MEWYIIVGVAIALIGLIIIIFKRRNGEEDIFESAGNRIKHLGACCSKIFGGR